MLIKIIALFIFTSCIHSGVSAIKKPTYTQQWKNEFTSEDSNWEKAGFFTFNESNAVFNPSGVSLKNGICELTISKRTEQDSVQAVLEGYDGEERPYNSAEYTLNDFSEGYMYGRFSSYMNVIAPPGVVASFFLVYYDWNEDYSKLLESSEIDIEFCGTTQSVEFTIHYTDPEGILRSSSAKKVSLSGKDAGDDYHLWEIEWLPTRISFYMDGKELYTFTDKIFLNEMEFPMKPDINYWVTKQNIWNVGTFDPSQLPITTRYDYISYASWDQAQ